MLRTVQKRLQGNSGEEWRERNRLHRIEERGESIYSGKLPFIANEETAEREFGSYKSISDNYLKYVVSLDEITRSINGIKYMNISEFLLKDEWNLVTCVTRLHQV